MPLSIYLLHSVIGEPVYALLWESLGDSRMRLAGDCPFHLVFDTFGLMGHLVYENVALWKCHD